MIQLTIFALLCASAFAGKATVCFNTAAVKGTVNFTEVSDGIQVDGEITGLSKGEHGFHVHVYGNIYPDCTAAGGHFNPHNQTHGARNVSARHVGDLGNIEADEKNVAKFSFVDNVISLSGENNIVGRAIVIHQDPDDFGKGGFSDSLTTGHAGARVACGVIGTL